MAGRLLLNYQSRLRMVLKRPTLEPHMSLEALNDTNIIGNATQSLLLHQLIVNAVQPSPLKPNFSRKELEVSSSFSFSPFFIEYIRELIEQKNIFL